METAEAEEVDVPAEPEVEEPAEEMEEPTVASSVELSPLMSMLPKSSAVEEVAAALDDEVVVVADAAVLLDTVDVVAELLVLELLVAPDVHSMAMVAMV